MAYGAQALFEKHAAMLPVNVVHSEAIALQRFTREILIYGGDFFATTCSQLNPKTLAEEPADGAVIQGLYQRENQRLGLGSNT